MPMVFHVITLFPDAFRSYLSESILKRAIEDKKIKVKFYNPRDFAENKWKRIDRKPYGGGPGMVIEAMPVIKAVEAALKSTKSQITNNKQTQSSKSEKLKTKNYKLSTKILWFSPSGKQFDTKYAKQAANKYEHLVFICGRYEGIDARVKKVYEMEEVSVGSYVLTGGELPAMVVMDSVARQIKGVLGDFNSLEESRVASPDVYTRPEVIEHKGKKYRVPKILLSGHQAKIEEWRLNHKNTRASHRQSFK